MTEKYKIYIPEDMKYRLTNDAELFEFFKKDGSVNLNAFLKQLLVTYFDPYRSRKEELQNTILSDLDGLTSISKSDANTIADKIINTYLRDNAMHSDKSSTITLTVSGRSLDVIHTIENNLLNNTSMSQYLKDLFQSYLSIPRNDREMIIFQDTFEDLKDAIKKEQVITFSSTTAPNQIFSVMPYIIAASKEEQCNYLLCCDTRTGNPRSFRVSRINSIFPTNHSFTPDPDIIQQLKEAAIRSPQSASKNVIAQVKLTQRGVHRFHVIVKNRPDVLKIEGDVYYFNWPLRQLEEYFKRFGKDALIISPVECIESMIIFHGSALEAYRKLSNRIKTKG